MVEDHIDALIVPNQVYHLISFEFGIIIERLVVLEDLPIRE
jgi:hypothetical protein